MLSTKGVRTKYENPILRKNDLIFAILWEFTEHGQPNLKTANQPSITTITPPAHMNNT
jgi:hypothetical protein